MQGTIPHDDSAQWNHGINKNQNITVLRKKI